MINEQFDKLTGLYTQKYFERRFEEEVSRTNRYKRPLTLMILEINYDYFKTDANVRWAMIYTILKQFGALLRKQLRNVDIGGRYSGETFVIVFPETNLEGGKI
ncbi:MAG: GGDEF domain-containing protein, partial [Vulcanimicrobiota bacterium]